MVCWVPVAQEDGITHLHIFWCLNALSIRRTKKTICYGFQASSKHRK
jgi:hypothetical protein